VPTLRYLMLAGAIVADLLSAWLYVYLFRYVALLASRVPDEVQTRNAARLAASLCVTVGIGALLHLFAMILPSIAFPRIVFWPTLLSGLDELFVLVLKLLAIGFFFRLAATLKEEFQSAQQIWSAPKRPENPTLHGV